ncbi:hypothetical protein ACVLD2_002636 [Paenibacillus sp. PvR052]
MSTRLFCYSWKGLPKSFFKTGADEPLRMIWIKVPSSVDYPLYPKR